MRKITSRILVILIIIIMLFEFCLSTVSYAAKDDGKIDTYEVVNSITNLIGGIVSIALWIKRIMAVGIAWIFDTIITGSLLNPFGIDNYFKGKGSATPADIFFGKYKLLDVDFFDIPPEEGLLNTIRTSVATWFYVLRLLSVAILLCILIYVGIRMALSTIAEDKAKYKQMLFDWVCSLILVFVLQYIAIFVININKVIVNFLRASAMKDLNDALTKIAVKATLGMGIGSIVATVIYVIIVFQTISFIISYLKRMLKVGFLIIISPLISITYSIDKIGDGKAQALNTWLKEFVYTILIQPFHCILYLAFANAAVEILTSGGTGTFTSLIEVFDNDFNQLANGFLAILCFLFINQGEDAIRKIFNFQDDNSSTSLAAGAALGVAAVSKINGAKNVGKGIATKVNKLTGGKAGAALKKSGAKLKNTIGKVGSKVGKAAGKTAGKVGKAAGKAAGKAGKAAGKAATNGMGKGKHKTGKKWTSAGGKKISSMAKSGAKKIGGAAKKFLKGPGKKALRLMKRSIPGAMKLMGFAMSLAAGQNAIAAIGIADKLEGATEEYFDSTFSTAVDNGSQTFNAGAEGDYDLRVREAKQNLEANNIKSNNRAEAETNAREILSRKNDNNPFTEEEAKAQRLLEDLELTSENNEIRENAKQKFMNERNSIEGVQKAMAIPHDKGELNRKANQIFEAICKIKAKQKATNDVNEDYDLTPKDKKQAHNMTNNLIGKIEGDVKRGAGSINIDKVLKEEIGGQNDEMAILLREYEQMVRAADMEQSINNVASLTQDEEEKDLMFNKYINKLHKKST